MGMSISHRVAFWNDPRTAIQEVLQHYPRCQLLLAACNAYLGEVKGFERRRVALRYAPCRGANVPRASPRPALSPCRPCARPRQLSSFGCSRAAARAPHRVCCALLPVFSVCRPPSASPQVRPLHPLCPRCHSVAQRTSTGSHPSLGTSCTQIVFPMRLSPAASPHAPSRR